MVDPIPTNAERVNFNDVIGTRAQASKFIPGISALVSTMKCLGCGMVHDNPGCTNTIKCDCGLSMQCTGAAVYIWREGV